MELLFDQTIYVKVFNYKYTVALSVNSKGKYIDRMCYKRTEQLN